MVSLEQPSPTPAKYLLAPQHEPAHIQQANNMVTTLSTTSNEELAKYHHQSMGLPPTSSLLRVLIKHPRELMAFPGLTRDLLNKFPPLSTATATGHMIRTRKGLRSTKNLQQDIEDARAQVDDMAPTPWGALDSTRCASQATTTTFLVGLSAGALHGRRPA